MGVQLSSPDWSPLNDAASMANIAPQVQQAALGQQQIQQNQNLLNQQAQQATGKAALAKIVSTPNMDDATFNSLVPAVAAADPQAAQGIVRQRQIQANIAQVSRLPADQIPMGIARMGIQYPEAFDNLNKVYTAMQGNQRQQTMQTASDIYGLLRADNIDGAIAELQQHQQAHAATGESTEAFGPLIQTLQADKANGTHNGLTLAAINLSAAMGPEKFADTYGKVSPEDVAKNTADASTAQTTAQFAPQKATVDIQKTQSDIQRQATQNATDLNHARVENGQLALDINKLAADTQLRMAEIDQKYGQLPDGSLKLVNDNAAQAASLQQTADKESQVASQMRSSGMHGGVVANAAEAWKRTWGSQDQYTQLRNEWQLLRNQGVLANKPAGVRMTDNELKFLQQGFPPLNASPQYAAQFLDAMAKVHSGLAQTADDTATWAAANGNLGPARKPLVIDGMRIPPGMTFAKMQALRTKLNPALPDDAQSVVQRAQQ